MPAGIPSNFLIGIKPIDDQHREIFEALEAVKVARDAGDSSAIPRQIETISLMLETHFEFEEEYMREIGYPMTEEHSRHHRQLLKRLADYNMNMNPAELNGINQLLDVLFRDMGIADLHLQEFIESQAGAD